MAYNNPNQTAPELILWEQYQKSEPIKQYFSFYHNYIQEYYNNLSTLSLEITPDTSNSGDYLEFLAKNLFNITRPISKIGAWQYDTSIKFDTRHIYDYQSVKPLSLDIFRRYLAFILNFNKRKWNVLNLIYLISKFTDISQEKIIIRISSPFLIIKGLQISVYIPKTPLSLIFEDILNSYKNPFLIPNNASLKIFYTEILI